MYSYFQRVKKLFVTEVFVLCCRDPLDLACKPFSPGPSSCVPQEAIVQEPHYFVLGCVMLLRPLNKPVFYKTRFIQTLPKVAVVKRILSSC